MGDLGSVPGLGRSLEEGKGYPLQYSGLENSMAYVVHGVIKSQFEYSIIFIELFVWASLMVQMVKNLPAMQETQV